MRQRTTSGPPSCRPGTGTAVTTLVAAVGLLAACTAPSGMGGASGDDSGKADGWGAPCETAPCSDPSAPPPWGLNDVSVLFPVGAADVAELPRAVNERDGERVVLLPEAVFDLLGVEAPFLTETPGRDQHYERLIVTSFRLDPCVDGFDPHAGSCSRAIRLVLQPAWPVGDEIQVYDASVHPFFELTQTEWSRLLADYNALRTEDLSQAPLGVHPVLAERGMTSELGQGLRDLIVEHARAATMTRMTFMATGRSGNNWFWGGFDRQPDESFALLEIPEVDSHGDGFHQNGRDSPFLPVDRPFFPNALLSDSTLDALTDEEVVGGLTELYAMENPLLTNATTVACGSCHLANETIDYVLARRSMDELDVAERYRNEALDVRRPVVENNRGSNVHAFSHAGRYPTVTQRAVNESATVVDYLRARDRDR